MPGPDAKNRRDKDYFSTEHLKTGLKRRAIKGAGITVFARTTVYAVNMLGVIVLARILTPDDVGLVALVTTLCMFLMDFGILGLTESTIQREEINHAQVSTLFWINVGLSVILTILLMLISPLIARFYGEPQLRSITIAIACVFILTGLSIQHLALIKRNMQFHRYALIDIASAVMSTISAVLMAWYGWGYWALVGRRLTMALMIAIGAWIFCRWRPGLPRLNSGVRPMLAFGINNFASNFVNYFSKNLDKILIGWRYGTQSLGYYSRAYHLFVLPLNQLTFPLGGVALATLSRLHNEPERYRRYFLKAISMLAFIGMPLGAIMTLTGSDLILLLLGPQWTKAGQIFMIFGPAIGIMIIYGTQGWLHLSQGRADRRLRWSIISFIVTVAFFVVGLPFGTTGVAVAYTASFYILVGPCLWYAGRPIDLKLSSIVSIVWRYYVAALLGVLLCWLILYSLDSTASIFAGLSTFVKILVSSLLCTAFYLIAVIGLHRSLEPISQFIVFIDEMRPDRAAKKGKTT